MPRTARNKVTVVGGGNVGATVAQGIARKELADVVVVDIVEGVPREDARPDGDRTGREVRLDRGRQRLRRHEHLNMVVITAGLPRKPGMRRDDLLWKNEEIVAGVTREMAKRSPNAILVIVSNPLDAMCEVARRVSGFPRERVLGMAGVLDSARMRAFIAMELNVSVENTHAFVLGGHGDTMVPLPRYSTVAGIPITELISAERIEAIVDRREWRCGNREPAEDLRRGTRPARRRSRWSRRSCSTGSASCRARSCSRASSATRDLFVGVPASSGAAGLERVLEIELTADEQAAFDASAAAVRELVEKL